MHAAKYSECLTQLAPEPRDIVWSNMSRSLATSRTREYLVLGIMVLLLLFWVIPVAALASLLSYQEIKKTMPWLAELIDSNEQIRAIVQNSLPSVAMITLNALLPFLLEGETSPLFVAANQMSFFMHRPHLLPRLAGQKLD